MMRRRFFEINQSVYPERYAINIQPLWGDAGYLSRVPLPQDPIGEHPLPGHESALAKETSVVEMDYPSPLHPCSRPGGAGV